MTEYVAVVDVEKQDQLLPCCSQGAGLVAPPFVAAETVIAAAAEGKIGLYWSESPADSAD